MKKVVRIALASMDQTTNSQKNLEAIKKYIGLAKRSGAEIVCFPESCFHPFKQFHLKHKFVREIREECKRNKIWAIVSDDMLIKKKYFNVALLINREGKIVKVYKKINTYDEDVEGGSSVGFFETDFAKIGIALCWDLNFPGLFKKLKERGAEIVFCPARWCYERGVHVGNPIERERVLLRSLISSRAFENLFFVALVNPIVRGDYFKDLVSYSGVASPHHVLVESFKKPGLMFADINLKEIARFQKRYNK